MADPTRPVLVACSHGTRSPIGQRAVAALVAAVAAQHPEVEVIPAFVDVETPDVPTALAAHPGREVRVVPLLLSGGYHVHVDLTAALAAQTAPPTPTLAPALGPDPALAELLADRLRAAGVTQSDTVLLGAAGSSDRRAVADCEAVARSVAELLGQPVAAAFLSAGSPRVADAIVAAREAGPDRVVVANYLLAPGYFDTQLRSGGADLVTPPMLTDSGAPDPRLVDLVWRRYRAE